MIAQRCAALAALLLSTAAAAEPHFHIGLAAGRATTDESVVENRESTITNARNIRTSFDDHAGAWKAFAGWRFNEYLGLDAYYARLGRSRLDTQLLGGDPPSPAGIVINRRVKGYGADVVVGAPLGERFAVFARAGLFRAQLDADATLSGNIVFDPGNPAEVTRTASLHERVRAFGAGIDWRWSPQAALRLEWQRFLDVGKPFAVGATGTTGEADIDLVTVGVLWRF